MEDAILLFGVLCSMVVLACISRMSRAPGRVDALDRQVQDLQRRVRKIERDAHVHVDGR